MCTTITATVDPAHSLTDVRTAEGHRVTMDGDPPEGGGAAARPKETLLAALAGCTAMDVASILRKKRQVPERYLVVVDGESAEAHPKVFTSISVEHQVTGDVQPEALRRSIELSATRYCPVNAMVSASVTVEHRYQLWAADGARHQAVVAVTGPEGSRVV